MQAANLRLVIDEAIPELSFISVLLQFHFAIFSLFDQHVEILQWKFSTEGFHAQ